MLDEVKTLPIYRDGRMPFVVEATSGGGSSLTVHRQTLVAAWSEDGAKEAGRELFKGRVKGKWRACARRANCHDLGMAPVGISPETQPERR